MKLRIALNIGEFAQLPWDAAIPLPNIGDAIIYMTPEGSRTGTLTSRTFSVGADPRDGSPLTLVHLSAG